MQHVDRQHETSEAPRPTRTASEGIVEVRPVRGRRDLTAFIKLPWRLYRGVDNWVPPLISERRQHLSRKSNPFFEHAAAEYFLAFRDGDAVGRIGAHVDHRFNDFHDNRWGMFGFYESEDDPAVARAARRCSGLAARAGARPHLRAVQLLDEPRARAADRGSPVTPADPRGLALPLLRRAARRLGPAQGHGPLQVGDYER